MNPVYVIAFVLAAAAVVYFLASKSKGGQGRAQAAVLYRNLLTKCFGDKEQVARLIELERERAPGASDVELMRNAIARWERDNR